MLQKVVMVGRRGEEERFKREGEERFKREEEERLRGRGGD